MNGKSIAKSFSVLVVAVLAVAVLVGCGQSDLPAKEQAAPPAPKAAPAADAAAAYPLQTCVVSGEKLGEMGAPVDFNYEGRLVRFCCKGCIAKFKADPQKYLKKLDEAAQTGASPKSPDGAAKCPMMEQTGGQASCPKTQSGGGGCCK